MLKNASISEISNVFQRTWLILICCVITLQYFKIHFSTRFYKNSKIHRTCSGALTWKHHILLIAGLCESLRMLITSICLSHSQSGGQWPRQHSLFDLHIKCAHRQAGNRVYYFHPSGHISQVSFSATRNHQTRKNVLLVCVHSSSYWGANSIQSSPLEAYSWTVKTKMIPVKEGITQKHHSDLS